MTVVPEKYNVAWIVGLGFSAATIGLWASSHLQSQRWSRVGVVFFSTVAAAAGGLMLHAMFF